jgi:hypothetical protein
VFRCVSNHFDAFDASRGVRSDSMCLDVSRCVSKRFDELDVFRWASKRFDVSRCASKCFDVFDVSRWTSKHFDVSRCSWKRFDMFDVFDGFEALRCVDVLRCDSSMWFGVFDALDVLRHECLINLMGFRV